MSQPQAPEKSPRAERPRSVWAPRLALVALVAAHFVFLMLFFEPAISQPDANGYFAQARLIVTDARAWFRPDVPLQYVGMHWLRTPDGRFFSRYPPGLPVLLAVPLWLFGPTAALLVNPILASLALVGLYLICREWVDEKWGLVAVAAMALNPVANARALAGDAHTSTAFFLVWGVYLLARWSGSFSLGAGFLAGLALGMIPTIRYPEALFGLAVGAFLLLHARRQKRYWLSVAAVGLGAAVPLAALLIHNQLAFGAFWRTGYSLTNEQTGFGWTYFLRNAVPYLQNILGQGVWVFGALGLVGAVVMCCRRDTWRRGALLLGLIAPLTLLYMAYYWAPMRMAGATMRFLVPTFFVYAVAGAWLLSQIARHHGLGAWVSAGVVLALTLAWGLPQSVRFLSRDKHINGALAKITDVLWEHVPPGSIVIAHSSVLQHLDFIGRWRLADEAVLAGRGARRRPGRRQQDPDAPSPSQRGKMDADRKRYDMSGRISVSKQTRADLKKWAGEDPVYWLGEPRLIQRLLPWKHKFSEIARIRLPKAKADPRDSRRRRPRPGDDGPPGLDGPPAPDRALGGPPAGGFPRAFARRPGRGGPGAARLLSGQELVLGKWVWPE